MRSMTRSLNRPTLKTQAGFSMIEMLMTAFILAVGILGLTMLQVMSMKASRGGRSLTTAVQVAELVMDQVEMEGRTSWLNRTDTQIGNASITPIAGLEYVGQPGAVVNFFNIKGQIPQPSSPDPADVATYFTVTTSLLNGTSPANHVAAGVGQMDDYIVTVDFVEAVNPTTSAPVHRTVTLTRRIFHD